MPLKESAATGSLIVATAVAAAGLNMGVLQLGEDEADEGSSAQSSVVDGGQPELVGLTMDAGSVPAPDPTPSSEQQPSVAMPAVTSSQDSTRTTVESPSTTAATTETSADSSTTSAAIPATEYLTYEFEGVATIIVALHDGQRLEFWSAIPAPGWAFMVEDDEHRKVKLKFRPKRGGDEAEWAVKFDDGRLKVKQEY